MAKEVRYPVLERSANLADRLADSVMELISGNALRPGDRLPSERELGARFGVSRTVVREALRSLAAKGVLDVRSGSGATVARISAAHAGEVLGMFVRSARAAGEGEAEGVSAGHVDDVREVLETRAAGIAAAVATGDDLAALRALHEQSRAAAGDRERAARLEVAFHRAVAAVTGNPLCLVVLDSVGPALLEFRLGTPGDAGRAEADLAAHEEILARIAARDPAGAEAAMRAHLARARTAREARPQD